MREQKTEMVKSVLDGAAQVRLGAIRASKPEKAEQLENVIISNAQAGRIQGQVSESQLIDLLEQIGSAGG